MADNLVMEEREEAIISPKGHTFVRKAHFLTPSIHAPVEAPPPHSPTNAAKYKDPPFKANFYKLKYPPEKWESWVHRMRTLHHPTWEKAGIFDAIMSSTSVIRRNNSLIYGFVEKWCPVTNSFAFPWGEATVTLEDMMVLGGYSVLGNSVLITPETSEMKEIVKELLMERSKMTRTKARKAGQKVWMEKFMNRGSGIEHEAFLAYWLSRFVFPINSIGRKVISIAVHLSRGIRIALAPAVLAGIYQNMSWLKEAMSAARKIGNGGDCDSVHEVIVSAPLALVQVWIWERFPALRPTPNIKPNETRMAHWHNIEKAKIEDLSLKIDSAAEIFEWRPYVKAPDSFCHMKIFVDNEYWTSVETGLNEELEELIRCLRTSELVGLEDDCIEQYLPHRVAMQFGMDQDIPGYVARENANPEIAWSNYNRPVRDKAVYVPPRLFEPGVTTRYLKWWKEIDNGLNGMATIDGKNCSEEIIVEVTEDSKLKETEINCGLNGMAAIDGKSNSENSKVQVEEDYVGKGTEEDLIPCTSNATQTGLNGKRSFGSSQIRFIEPDSIADISSHPGFSPKLKKMKACSENLEVPVADDSFGKGTEDEYLIPCTSNGTEEGLIKARASGDVEVQIDIPSTGNNGIIQELKSLPKPAESEVKNTRGKEGTEQWTDIGLRLEERITVIEKLCDLLKKGKLMHFVKKLNK